MIDFSAFPERKRGLRLDHVAVIVMASIVFVFGLVYLTTYIWGDEIGMLTLRIVSFSMIAISLIVLMGIVFWFARDVVWRRIKVLTSGQSQMYMPPSIISIVSQFAQDNNFEFREYPSETPAPAELYTALMTGELDSRDDVYIIYEVLGRCCGANFRYYCFAYTDPNHGMGYYERRAHAYANLRDGRAVGYTTVLAVDRPVRPWYKGAVQAFNAPNGYVFCHGQVANRQLIQRIFNLAKDRGDAG